MRLILRSVSHTRHVYQLDLVDRLHKSHSQSAARGHRDGYTTLFEFQERRVGGTVAFFYVLCFDVDWRRPAYDRQFHHRPPTTKPLHGLQATILVFTHINPLWFVPEGNPVRRPVRPCAARLFLESLQMVILFR